MRKKFLSIVVAIALVFTTIAQPTDALANGSELRGDSFDSATTVNFAQKYTGTITKEDSIDFYKFTLESSGRISFNIVVKTRDVRYTIYDADHNEIIYNEVIVNSQTGQGNASKELDLVKGEYYIAFSERYMPANSKSEYNFTMKYDSANESFSETKDQNNNLMENSNVIKLNTKYKGQIAKNDNRDFYKFTLNNSGKITLVAESKMSNVTYNLYDAEGKELWEKNVWWNDNIGSGILNENVNLTKGTYYFRVGDNYKTGNYSFTLKFTSASESFSEVAPGNNNTIETSDKISLNKRYKGQIALNDEKDFYKFSIPKKQKIVISINEDEKNKNDYKIFKFNGEEIWDHDNWQWNDQSNTQTIELGKGTYYFLAYRYNRGSRYNFMFTSLAKPATPVMLATQRVSSTNIKVRWKSVSGVTGYKIYRSTTNKSGSFKLVKTVSSKYTYWKNSGLKKGKTYYWKVRAYKSAGGERIYSNYSKAVKRRA